ncbi:EAL domain-containing protein [Thiolapillus sp.]
MVRSSVLTLLLALAQAGWAGQTIDVGIYQNEPKIFANSQGQPDGFFVELLGKIAAEEGWFLNYLPCEWPVCLNNLEQGKIDLLPDVAYSEERARHFLFGREVVLSSWSVVYVRDDNDIPSLKELDGKSLAVVKGSIQFQAIREKLEELEVSPAFHEVNSFSDVFRLVKIGWVDAGLVNTYFGRKYASEYQLKKTNILVRPSLLSFAAAPNRQPLLDTIDKHLAAYKSDSQSVYYQLIANWFSPLEVKQHLPPWIKWVLILGSLAGLLLTAIAILFHFLIKRKTAELSDKAARLEHLANHDPLTSLPNRKLFFDRLQQSLHRAEREDTVLAVLYIDLDQFKQINDSFGHAIGDEVLKEIAARLESAIRDEDTIARLGGDEFAVIMESLKEAENTLHCVQRLNSVFKEPVAVHDLHFVLSASIGISLFPQDGTDAHTLLRNADTAMFKAKEAGRGTFQFYVEDMTRNAVQRARLETDLRQALEGDGLEVHYQPQIGLKDGRIVGFEALARWRHPELGILLPNQFIPLAEDSGLILPLGEWVLRTACRQISQWHSEGIGIGTVAVNISAHQLTDYALLDVVKKVLRETGCHPEWLELELTESSIMTQTQQAVSVMNQLRELGVQLAIDDFGTGYSSLAYLRLLPIAKLKIDRSFIKHVAENVDDVAIVRAVTALGKTLNLKVVAEGVETREQETLLRTEGCDEAQGYYYSRALLAAEAKEFLRQQATHA